MPRTSKSKAQISTPPLKKRDYDEVIKLTETLDEESPLNRYRAEAFHRRGVERYYAGKVTESIADFDACASIFKPDRDPYHWQRGISYYHAGEYEKGKAQFERHQTVNPAGCRERRVSFHLRRAGRPAAPWRKRGRISSRSTRIRGCR